MIKFTILALAFAATALPAEAAGFLSRTGSGTSCTQSSPCSSMAAAITAAGAGGVVVCLDRGDYSGAAFVDINTSLTISCGDGLWQGNGTQIRLNPPAGSSVLIEGFVSDGNSTVNGIVYTGQGTLELLRVRVSNNSSSFNGLNFAPTGPGTLHVSDSVFYDISGSGVLIRPTGSGYANVHMQNVKLQRGANGLFIDGSASTIGINVSVSNSMFAENAGNGIGAHSPAGGAPIRVSLKDSQITGNLTNGLGALSAAASGAGSATILVGSSMISANVNGIATSGAGQIRTFGNNQVQFNGNNGAFTGSVGLQ